MSDPMPAVSDADVVVLSAHARDVPAEERERWRTALVASSTLRGSVLLATCHRVDLYLASVPAEPLPPAPVGTRRLAGGAAIRHVLAVAVGLDSAVVGEDQVLHQLRCAVTDARARGPLGAALDRLLQTALREGRRTRAWRSERRSMADAALDLVERNGGRVRDGRILVIGAGRMGSLVAREARVRGAAVTISSRREASARTLAGTLGATAATLDPGPEITQGASGVVIALSGRWEIAPATIAALVDGGAPVVDLSTPAALDAGVIGRLGSRAFGVDALAVAADVAADGALRARLAEVVDEAAAEHRAWLGRRASADAARIIADRAEHERRAELDHLWRRLPTLDASERDAIDEMSRHLARRLLREPLARLGADGDAVREAAARDLFGV